MNAPTVCVLLPDAGCDRSSTILAEVRRFGFDRAILVDPEGPCPALRPDLAIESVQASGLQRRLEALMARHDTAMVVGAGAALVANWLDLVPRLAAEPSASVALALSGAGLLPSVALLRREAVAEVVPELRRRGLSMPVRSKVLTVATSLRPDRRLRPAVFFDRDGVINADHGYVGDLSRFAFMPEAIAAVKAVNDRGALAFLVTNQSGVARGFFSEADVAELHRHMNRMLRLSGAHFDDIRVCPHLPDAAVPAYRVACLCRKPAPGMILDLIGNWPVDPSSSLMIGDKDSDVAAGRAAGLRGLLYRGEALQDVVVAALSSTPRVSP